MRVLKGAEVSAKIKEEVQAALAKCKGAAPKLAIIRVGENPDDMSYERGATKKMENFGLRVQSYVYPADITDADFKAEFTKINEDPDVTGILMLRPLPKQICEKDIEGMIDPAKDLDGISPVNIAKVFEGDDSGFAPCTAEAVIEVLKAAEIPVLTERNPDDRKTRDHRRTQHGCGQTAFHVNGEGKCHSNHLPYQNQRSGRHLPQCGDPGGCSRTGENAERRLCCSGCCGD